MNEQSSFPSVGDPCSGGCLGLGLGLRGETVGKCSWGIGDEFDLTDPAAPDL
ncbi:unnamed protein product [Penicillium roqueforti FM164]|uniref:Genomic scaffold, ProqFM164S01 n=1 Tax=Penicillium roqueforti (strain FM164) TaxID=1365484 RepID=W6PV83_PENRF|nr:unnamed protein product [Penicillium roqueforti FM164]